MATPKWKEVTIGGVSGILLGAAGAFFSAKAGNIVDPEDVVDDPEGEDVENAEEVEEEVADQAYDNDVAAAYTASGALATGVNDDMTFNEAFAAARHDVGAGGYFVWHGNVYGTYYANEWNQMTPAQQSQFSSGNPHVEVVHHIDPPIPAPGPEPDPDPDPDPEFQILGVEHTQYEGVDVTIGTASVSGQAVYFMDIDQNDEFDYMITDINGNQQIDEDEFIDISAEHVSVSEFEAMALATGGTVTHSEDDAPVVDNPVDQYYANNDDLPDYVNDADPGILA